jgi:hypothetical protein
MWDGVHGYIRSKSQFDGISWILGLSFHWKIWKLRSVHVVFGVKNDQNPPLILEMMVFPTSTRLGIVMGWPLLPPSQSHPFGPCPRVVCSRRKKYEPPKSPVIRPSPPGRVPDDQMTWLSVHDRGIYPDLCFQKTETWNTGNTDRMAIVWSFPCDDPPSHRVSFAFGALQPHVHTMSTAIVKGMTQ